MSLKGGKKKKKADMNNFIYAKLIDNKLSLAYQNDF